MKYVLDSDSMKIIAIVQARMQSERFEGKAMAEIKGSPMLCHVVWAAQRIVAVNDVVVAVPLTPESEDLTRLCVTKGFEVFAGSHLDVLDRYYWAAKYHNADVIVRITGDCPMLNPSESSRVVLSFLHQTSTAHILDYLSNAHPIRTAPKGYDTEVFSHHALKEAWENAKTKNAREHVTPWIIDNMICGKLEYRLPHADQNYSVDTPEDYERVKALMESEVHPENGELI